MTGKEMDLKSFKGGAKDVLATKERKKPGRKSKGEKLSEYVNVYMTSEEKKLLEEKAGLAPTSAFIRKALQDAGII